MYLDTVKKDLVQLYRQFCIKPKVCIMHNYSSKGHHRGMCSKASSSMQTFQLRVIRPILRMLSAVIPNVFHFRCDLALEQKSYLYCM